MTTSREMTTGPALPLILNFTLPLLLGNLLQQTYSLVDAAIVGQFLGIDALAGVGASSSVIFLILGFCNGCCCGFGIPVAQRFGARDYADMRRYVANALRLAVGISVTVAIVTSIWCADILHAMRTPDNIFRDAYLYLLVTFIGIPCTFFYNLLSNIIRALGDSRTPFYFLVFSSVTNVILDYFMVRPWGIAGVAWATFIAQGAACLLTLFAVFLRLKKIKTEEKPKIFSGALLKMLLLLALPVALQNSFVSVGNLIVQVKINGYGDAVMAGFTAGSKLMIFCTTCFCTCANGLTNFVSQNYGAHEFTRIKRGFYAELVISTLLVAAFFAAVFSFAEPLVKLFLSEEEDTAKTLEAGVQFVRIVSPFFFAVNVKVSADAAVRGSGGNAGFMVSTFTDLLLRVAFAFILTPSMGFAGVCWAWPVGWTLSTFVALAYYFRRPCLKKSYIAASGR